MRSKMAQKISDALSDIRDCYNAKSNDQPFSKSKLRSAQSYLDEICSYIDSKSSDVERDFIFYCLGELDELLGEENDEKTARFAHAIHRIPFIFSGEEKWDKDFKKEYIFPFRDMYGNDYFSEILDMKVHIERISPNKVSSGKRTIYRYNEMNLMSLPAYFCFRLLVPIIVIPFLLGAMLFVHFYDYTETDRGERYEIDVESFEYETDYLSISAVGYSEKFEIPRFFELSNSPEELIDLCESKATLVAYAKYTQIKNEDPYYQIIHLEDTDGNVYRSYEHTNEMDRYWMIFLFIAFLIFFIPSFILFVMMLAVASDPRKYVNHPRFVKFCFPDYSLQLKRR
ncbi:MAG: hypothetical protein IJ011_03625 [Clostridia bacterium]|nr:hypothetical protein [Clostridia bacterium]